MNKVELTTKLELVGQALAAHDLVPVLTHFWFTGTTVMAFNEHTAISSPCKTDFVAAVPGPMLKGLVSSIQKQDELELIVQDKELLIRCTGTKLRMGLYPVDKFIFEMPKPKKGGGELGVDPKEFLDALALCMRSVTANTAQPQTQGVTLIPGKQGVKLFSTNDNTLTAIEVPYVDGGDMDFDRILMPIGFCNSLLSMAKGEEKIHLEINEEYCLHKAANGDILWGRIAPVESPINFENIMARKVPKDIKKSVVPVPKKMMEIVDRAIIIIGEGVEEGQTILTIEKGVLKIESKSNMADGKDQIKLHGDHEDITVTVKMKQLKIGCEIYDQFRITEKDVVMTKEKGPGIFLVSIAD